jgi:hypothetical protein
LVLPSQAWTNFLLALALVLVLACIIGSPPRGKRDFNSLMWMGSLLLMAIGLVRLALQQAQGRMRWAAPDGAFDAMQAPSWRWQNEGDAHEHDVRLLLAIDLQNHLLLRLTPQTAADQAKRRWRERIQSRPVTVWLFVSPANTYNEQGGSADWPALRRALYWRAGAANTLNQKP